MRILFRFLWAYVAPYWHWYAAGTVALFATNWLSVTIPLFLAEAIDALSLGPQGRSVLLRNAAYIALMGASVMLVRTASRLLFFTPGRLVEARIKHDLFARVLEHQPPFLDQWPVGDLVSRNSSDTTMVRLLAGFATLGIVNTVVALGLAGRQMWSISPELTTLTLGPLSMGFLVTLLAANRLRSLMRRLQETSADLSDAVLASYQGVGAIHAFGAETAFLERFETFNQRWLKIALERSAIRVAFGPLLSLAATVNVFILLYIGGPMAVRQEISVGELIAFTTLIAYLIGPLRGMSFIVTLFRQAEAALDRIYAILQPEPERPDLPHPKPAPPEAPGISIQNLSFAYPKSPEQQVLNQINVEVPAGGTLGVLGPTGSGKTTLLRLLARLYNPPEGTIWIDGVDVLQLDLIQWRHKMQLVPQRAFLFTETVRDNILLGHPESRLEEVVALTALEQDLDALPEGTDTLVGEAGLTLSGGQRQRVALARGLVTPKSVLMLDDVLSAVDHATEQALISSLRSQGDTPTTVIVSNRCSAIRHADVILVLDEGQVVDQGIHEDLISRPGMYANVWERQREGEEGLT